MRLCLDVVVIGSFCTIHPKECDLLSDPGGKLYLVPGTRGFYERQYEYSTCRASCVSQQDASAAGATLLLPLRREQRTAWNDDNLQIQLPCFVGDSVFVPHLNQDETVSER